MVTGNTGPSTARPTSVHSPGLAVASHLFPWPALAEAYQFRFTDEELRLLSTDEEELSETDRERAYHLRCALRPEQCPACHHVLCQRSAWPGAFEPGHTSTGPGYVCPCCGAQLEHERGIRTGHSMVLAPGQQLGKEHHPGLHQVQGQLYRTGGSEGR